MKNKARTAPARVRAAMLRHDARKFVSTELARIQTIEKDAHRAACEGVRQGRFKYEFAYGMSLAILFHLDRTNPIDGGIA